MSEIVAPIITDSTGQAIATAISGAVSKADKSDIAPEFSTSADYAKGSMVYYQGTLYEFTAAHNHAAWTGNDVIAVKVSSEINTLKSGLTDLIVSDIKSSVGQTVAAGDDAMFTIDVTKQGYTPIFYTTINTQNSRLVPYYYELSGNTLSVAVHNYATGSLDGAVSALVLYRHN